MCISRIEPTTNVRFDSGENWVELKSIRASAESNVGFDRLKRESLSDIRFQPWTELNIEFIKIS